MHAWLGFLAECERCYGILIISVSLGLALALAAEIATILAVVLLIAGICLALLHCFQAQFKQVKPAKQ